MVFQVIPKFKHLVHAAMKKAGDAPGARKKVFRDHPEWFLEKGKGAKGSKTTSAPKAASKAKSLSGHPLSSTGNRSGRSAWDRLPQRTKDKLLKEKGKGMSKGQLEKYREMYRNRN